MENERTFFAPRKIRVVGCVNCPYYSPKRVINKMEAKCNHPSFRHSIEFLHKGGICESLPGDPPNFIPDWCPLEFEICNVCAE